MAVCSSPFCSIWSQISAKDVYKRQQWGDRNYADIAPGDASFFDWDGSGNADHVGIVVGVDESRVYTVEGNSGSDACNYKSYPRGSSVIRGYGLMLWP